MRSTPNSTIGKFLCEKNISSDKNILKKILQGMVPVGMKDSIRDV